jgi:hypothetical protein
MRDHTKKPRYHAIAIGALLSSAAWAGEPTRPAGQAQAQPEAEGVLEPQADAQLHKMSDYLDGLQSFRVDNTTIDEKVSTTGQKIQEIKESHLAARRPNQLRVDRRGPAGHVVFRYDGKQFSIDAIDKNVYATETAPPTLDAAIDDARDRLHIDAPAGDLLVPDSYHALTDGLVTGRYVGREPLGNGMAHHIAVTKKDVDYQLWIADGAQPVPLRYVITSKDLPGQPQFTAELHNWQPNAAVPADSFAFTPRSGGKRIAFAPQPQTTQHQ